MKEVGHLRLRRRLEKNKKINFGCQHMQLDMYPYLLTWYLKCICILVSSLLNYIDWMDLTQRHSFCKDTEDGFIFKNP